MPYEILKGARPPRWMVRMHYVKTREMVEARIPAIANLPKIEPQIPGVPSGMPTVPSVIWSRIIYPYDIAMQFAGPPSPEQPVQPETLRIASQPASRGALLRAIIAFRGGTEQPIHLGRKVKTV